MFIHLRIIRSHFVEILSLEESHRETWKQFTSSEKVYVLFKCVLHRCFLLSYIFNKKHNNGTNNRGHIYKFCILHLGSTKNIAVKHKIFKAIVQNRILYKIESRRFPYSPKPREILVKGFLQSAKCRALVSAPQSWVHPILVTWHVDLGQTSAPPYSIIQFLLGQLRCKRDRENTFQGS